ncbi:MAG: translocation/assembly module TamB domain-containing protein [Chromatiaceae bacterium]|nr:translocation/assembly module TamB domain-containing protein [Candidatus Thioaporhodococcus sediminis]
MRLLLRFLRIVGFLLLILVGVPLLLLTALLLAANTDPGRRLIADQVGALSDGLVRLQGLEGHLPLSPRLARLEISDAGGVWLHLDAAALELDPWPLLWGRIQVSRLSAQAVHLARPPTSARETEEPPTDSGAWPIPAVELGQLSVQRLTLGEILPNAPALSVAGHGTLTSLSAFDSWLDPPAAAIPEDATQAAILSAWLELRTPDREDHYQLRLDANPQDNRLELKVQEAPDGLISALLRHLGVELPPEVDRWQLAATGRGPLAALALEAKLAAGPLQVSADGVLDLSTQAAQRLQLRAELPALALGADLGVPLAWQAIHLRAELSGSWFAPHGQAHLDAEGLSYAASNLSQLTAHLRGDNQGLKLSAVATGAELPDVPAEISREPLRIEADIAPQAPGLPFNLDFDHPIAGFSATGRLAELAGQASLKLPRLTTLGQILGRNLEGSAQVNADFALASAASHYLGWPAAKGTTPANSPDLSATLDLDARFPPLGTARIKGQLAADLTGQSGKLNLEGDWDGQPLSLQLLGAREGDGTLELSIEASHLAGVNGQGQLRLPPDTRLPLGKVELKAPKLADLQPLVGQPLAGSLDLLLDLTTTQASIRARGQDLNLPGKLALQRLTLDGQVSDPLTLSGMEARLQLEGLAVASTRGDLSLTATGSQQALALISEGHLETPLGPTRLTAEALLDLPGQRLTLSRFDTLAQGQNLRLQNPAVLAFEQGVEVDRLRLELGSGSLDLGGRLLPDMDLQARIDRLDIAWLTALAGQPLAAGLLDARAELKGPPAAPTGKLGIKASGLLLASNGGFGLPPAALDASLSLKPDGNQLDARVALGPQGELRLQGPIGGTLPLAPGSLGLRAAGHLDLHLLDPLLTASGREANGRADLNVRIGGSASAPRLDGRLHLTGITFRDWKLGLSLTGLTGDLVLDDQRLRLERVRAQAGAGTLALNGKVELFDPDRPLDLTLTARGAEPLRSDLLSLKVDADLSLRGPAQDAILAGNAHFSRIDIRLPEHLAASVPVLRVHEEGPARQPRPTAAPRERTAAPFRLAFDLSLDAPRSVYIRGQGVDAELGGELRVQGQMADPTITGGFNLIRGEYKLIGQTLRFTQGHIGLDGATGLNPTLNLEARVTAAGSTAILGVKGTASAPRIELRGEPELPQDEVLSRLLFGVAGTRLSPWQTAQVGLAAARLAGIGPKGPGLLESARTALGLDRLSIGTDQEGGTTAEAGRQLSERVYLGARQGTRAGETQGVMRIELTPNLKLETDIGASSGSRAGIAYEKEY